MNELLVLLPLAIGFALSPIPVIEMILVLFSDRRRINAVAFVVSLALASAVGLALGAAGSRATGGADSQQNSSPSLLLIALGVLLLVVGINNLRNRADESEPAVLASIRGMGPGAVSVIAVGTALFNPKNLPLLLAAGAALAGMSAPIAWGAVFVVLCTAPYWVSALYAELGGSKARKRLDAMRDWLTRRNRLIMGVLCVLLGAVVLVKAFTA